VTITAAQWKRAVSPALDSDTSWAFRGKFAYRTPVEWFAFGVLGEGSAFAPNTLYVWSVWMPLYKPMEHLWMSHGTRVPNGTTTHGLDDIGAAAALALRELPTDEGVALERVARSGPSREEAAYGLILTGQYPEARRALFRPDPASDVPDWVRAEHVRRTHMLKLLDEGPERAMAQLREWRATTMQATGLS
jgi:hypothetical protein